MLPPDLHFHIWRLIFAKQLIAFTLISVNPVTTACIVSKNQIQSIVFLGQLQCKMNIFELPKKNLLTQNSDNDFLVPLI